MPCGLFHVSSPATLGGMVSQADRRRSWARETFAHPVDGVDDALTNGRVWPIAGRNDPVRLIGRYSPETGMQDYRNTLFINGPT
jgi:hypothetical protein